MAQPTNTVSTYNIRGIAEDVDNKIYILDQTETPFLSSLEADKITQRSPQWQEDTYRAANKDNALIEGDDFTGGARTPTNVLTNVMQTFSEQIVTSRIANKTRKYGRDSQQGYEMKKAMIALKKDAEAAFLSNNIAAVGTNATASKMAG
ncbi:MAG: SU10 major capsid protein, partial [Burkholderiaceae bacterium]